MICHSHINALSMACTAQAALVLLFARCACQGTDCVRQPDLYFLKSHDVCHGAKAFTLCVLSMWLAGREA
jgi:hypothetical protein